MRVAVIGSGIGGMAIAIKLAKDGHHVTVYEKNEVLGGRAGVFEAQGFVFDMGPSWYLMPNVFERFFESVGENVHEHLNLIRLDPSYRVFFEGSTQPVDAPSSIEGGAMLVESLEPGAGAIFKRLMQKTKKQYELIANHLLYKEYRSPIDLFSTLGIKAAMTLPLSTSLDRYLKRFFKSDKVRKLLEYTMVFLGASPYNAPAFYSMMAYVDFGLGVYYPQGGIYTLIQALENIGKKHGVIYKVNSAVKKIEVVNGAATNMQFADGTTEVFDVVVSNADVHHTETALLSSEYQSYPSRYWQKTELAPSMVLVYVGIKGKIPELIHHNFYFAEDWQKGFDDIFIHKKLSENPSFYICAPSKTDPHVAPEADENLFILVPVASHMQSDIDLETYVHSLFDHISKTMDIDNLEERIVYKKIFGPQDFAERYNSVGGSGLGISHTLRQSLFLRPSNKSSKVSNLYYTGQMVQPGIGMPICLISAELTYNRIKKDYGNPTV